MNLSHSNSDFENIENDKILEDTIKKSQFSKSQLQKKVDDVIRFLQPGGKPAFKYFLKTLLKSYRSSKCPEYDSDIIPVINFL